MLGGAPAGAAADVHAWGATLAHAATGRPPYGSGPVEVVLHRVLAGELDVAGVPRWLEVLLRAATDLDPTARPDPHDLLHALDALEASDVMREALGDHIFTEYIRLKREEWTEYNQQVHQWEIDAYMDRY